MDARGKAVTSEKPHTVSVIVPVHNGEASLPELVRRLALVLPAAAPSFEVILVDDGSRDRSAAVAAELRETYPFVRVLRLLRNYGQHNALLCGIRHARYTIVVTIDDDLQHRPEHIPLLLSRLDDGCDLVYGSPAKEQHGALRDFSSKLTKIDGVIVEHDARAHGISNYRFRQLLEHAANMLTGFSVLPLRVASLLGLGLTMFGAALLVYVLGRYALQGSPVPGFPFLASLIIIFSGTQLFVLGVIGEYLARMHLRLLGKPTYALREEAGDPAGDGRSA